MATRKNGNDDLKCYEFLKIQDGLLDATCVVETTSKAIDAAEDMGAVDAAAIRALRVTVTTSGFNWH